MTGPEKLFNKIDMLVVDDHPDEIAGTLTALERQGACIKTAKDMTTAEALLKEKKFHLALIDMRIPIMPDGDFEEEGGKRLIENLHSGQLGPRNKKIPFMVVTAQKRSIRNYEFRQDKTCIGVFGKLMHTRILSELGAVAADLNKSLQ